MSLKPLFKSIMTMGFFALAGCNQYSDGGLVGDYKAASKCPANGCANQSPNPNLIKISNGGTAVTLYPTASDSKVEINGDCYISTYPNNKINVTVTTQNGNVPVNVPVYSATGSTTSAACRNGRYDVVLDIRGLSLNNIYTVKLELVALDSSNAPFTNAGGGYLYLSLVR